MGRLEVGKKRLMVGKYQHSARRKRTDCILKYRVWFLKTEAGHAIYATNQLIAGVGQGHPYGKTTAGRVYQLIDYYNKYSYQSVINRISLICTALQRRYTPHRVSSSRRTARVV